MSDHYPGSAHFPCKITTFSTLYQLKHSMSNNFESNLTF